jgi:hypothetical protein
LRQPLVLSGTAVNGVRSSFSGVCGAPSDFYGRVSQVLGVGSEVGDDEIKKAYRNLAKVRSLRSAIYAREHLLSCMHARAALTGVAPRQES